LEQPRKITPTPYSKLQTQGLGAVLEAVIRRTADDDFWVADPSEPFTQNCRVTTIEQLLLDGDEAVEVWFNGVPLGVINLLALPMLEGELPLSYIQKGEEECEVTLSETLWSTDPTDFSPPIHDRMLAAFRAQGPRLKIHAAAQHEPYRATVSLFAHGAEVECSYVWGELLWKLQDMDLDATEEELRAVEADAAAWISQRMGEEYTGIGARLTKSFSTKDFRLLMQWIDNCQQELDSLEEQTANDLRAYVQERLAGMRQARATSPGWNRAETFAEFRAIALSVSRLPQPATDGLPKPLDRFPAFRRISAAFGSGEMAFHTLNNRAELELYILCNDPQAIERVNWEFGTLGSASSSRFEVDLAVYEAAGNPTFYPFVFDMNTAQGRYEAAAFCEQPGLPVFAVTLDNTGYVVAYCRTVQHSDRARRHFRNCCRTILGIPQVPPPPEEVSLEEIMSLGTAYAFEPSKIGSDSTVAPEVLEAFQSLSSDRSKLIRNGPFTLWTARSTMLNKANQWTEGVLFIVSPAFSIRTKGRTERDPLMTRLERLPGFIRAEDTYPLYEGAVPAYRYLAGQVHKVPQTDELRQELQATWEMMYQATPRGNPYRA
jgi:hypothetical protein